MSGTSDSLAVLDSVADTLLVSEASSGQSDVLTDTESVSSPDTTPHLHPLTSQAATASRLRTPTVVSSRRPADLTG